MFIDFYQIETYHRKYSWSMGIILSIDVIY